MALGIDDPEQWLHEATDRKIAIWEAFFQVEPWGCEWERTAIIASAISNTTAAVHGVKKENLYKLQDFMPIGWAGRKPSNKGKKRGTISDFYKFAKQYRKS